SARVFPRPLATAAWRSEWRMGQVIAAREWNSFTPWRRAVHDHAMRHSPIDPRLFIENRRRLMRLLPPGSLAVVNANDIPPTNADGTLRLIPNSDLFYLSGVEQEESILVMFPDASDERQREILFLRETSEQIAIWEGHKLTKESAREVSGVRNVQWLAEFPRTF